MRRNTKSLLAIFSAATAAAALLPGAARAADITFAVPGPADFNVGTNWTGGVVPGTADYADINNGGTATVSASDPLWVVNQLFAGNGTGTSGNVLQTGDTINLSGGFLVVGKVGGSGTYNITGGTINQNVSAGAIRLFGSTANGAGATEMYVSGTAAINNAGQMDIGYTNGTVNGAATLNISGGTFINQGQISIGNGPLTNGVLQLTGGTFNTSANIVVANNANGATVNQSSASVTVSGGSLQAGGELQIGQGGGTATFLQNGGAVSSGQWLAIGRAGGNGTYTLNSGTLTTNLVGSNSIIADNGGAGADQTTGLLTVNGGTFNTTGGELWIGQAGGHGTLVLNGGTVQTRNWVAIGRDTGSVGVLTINGGTFIHTGGNTGNGNSAFEVGSFNNNTSTLNLNGGVLNIDFIRTESSGVSTINLNGGTLQSNISYGGTIGGNGTITHLNDQNGGAIFNTSGGTFGITQTISHGTDTNAIDGGIIKNGTGYLVLDGSNNYTGSVTVNDGILQILSDASLGAIPSTVTNDLFLNNAQLINHGNVFDLNANRTIVITGTGYIDPGWAGYNISGSVTGNGNLSIPFDSGALLLRGSDSYTGMTVVGSTGADGSGYYSATGATSVLRLGNNNALPSGTYLTFGVHPNYPGNVQTFDTNGYNATIGGLNGSGTALIENTSNSSSSVLTLGSNTGYSSSLINSGTTYTYTGVIQNSLNSSGTSLGITKVGPGTQVLAGINTYTGPTVVNAGKLYINSSLAAGGSVTINSGGTFGGTGVIASPIGVTTGGTLEAGYLGSGSLNASGGITFASGSLLSIGNVSNYQGSSPAAVQTSAVTFNGSVGVSVGAATGGLAVGSTFDLLSYSSENTLGSFSVVGALPSRATGTIADNGAGMVILTITNTSSITWTGAQSSTWDTATTNWQIGGTPTKYIDNPGDTVVFDDTASNFNVSVPAVVHPNYVTFNNSAHNYVVSGAGGIAGLTGLTKTGTGMVTLDTSNSYIGATLIQQGTLQLGTGGALSPLTTLVTGNGSTSGIFILGDSTGAVNTAVAALNTSGSATTNSVQGGNASAVSTLSISTSGTEAYSGTVGGSTATANNIALGFTGGTLNLTGSNTYTGGTTVNSGLVIANNNSTLGTGTVTFTGTGASAVGTNPSAPKGTVQAAANVTLPNNFNLGSAAVVFDTNGHTMNLSGSIVNTATNTQVLQPFGTGTLILSGQLNINGNNNDTNNPAILMGRNGSTLAITGGGNVSGISIGWYGTQNSLILNPTSTLNFTNTNTSLDVGQGNSNGAGGVVQNGGNVVMAGYIQLGKWDGSFGSYVMNAGTLTAAGFFEGGGGNGPGNTTWVQNGGIVNNTGAYTTLGQNGGAHSNWVMNAGAYNNTNNLLTVANGGGSYADATINSGTLNVSGIAMSNNGDANAEGIVTFNGGTTYTGFILPYSGNSTNIVNFNGGQVVATSNSSNFLSSLTAASVYAGGATINTSSNSITVAQSLTTAGGLGGLNSAATVSSGGSGYVGAPTVVISGGGGQGATAYATITNGVVTGVTVTNPGTGYTSAPTITLYGGGGTGASLSAPSPTANAVDGGLTKLGTGILTLTASNNYTGGTQIKAGQITVANTNALGTGVVTMYNATTLAIANVPGPIVPINSSNSYVNTNGNFTPVFSNNGNTLQLTSAANSEATSAFTDNGGFGYTIDDSKGFAVNFTYSHGKTGGQGVGADGVTFTLLGASGSPTVVGGAGGSLGYVSTVTPSVASTVDLYYDTIETGVDGALVNTGGISATPFLSQSASENVSIVYTPGAGGVGTLTETLTSAANGASYTLVTPNVDIASILNGGSNAGSGAATTAIAYLGFTGATGGVNDAQYVSNLAYNFNGLTLSNGISVPNSISVLPAASTVVQLAPTNQYSSGSVGPITIGSGGTLAVSVGANPASGVTHGVLTTPSVTISNASSGTLDVKNNALDITSQSLASVNALTKSGFNNGAWNGPGISSSTAAADPSYLTAVGTILNTDGSGHQVYGSGTTLGLFDGANPAATDVLVKYTYYGDANLDGRVDGSDYSLIDNGFNNHLTGWYNGDFNYDGVIDGSDYTLIDNAFNTQGASLAAEIASASATAQIAGGGSAVPEPASLGLMLLGGASLLGRRRRR